MQVGQPLWAWGGEGAAIAKGEAYLEPHNERCPCFKRDVVQADKGVAHWDKSNPSSFYKLIWAAIRAQGSRAVPISPPAMGPKGDAPTRLQVSQLSRFFQARDVISQLRAQRVDS